MGVSFSLVLGVGCCCSPHFLQMSAYFWKCIVFFGGFWLSWLLASVAFGFWLSWLSSHAKEGRQEGRTRACEACGLWLLRVKFHSFILFHSLSLSPYLHFQLHKVLHLPQNLHFKVHKVLRLPQNLHFKVHKVLRIPRFCTSRSTKYCTCDEICTFCTSRTAKYCTCHEKRKNNAKNIKNRSATLIFGGVLRSIY